MTRNELIAYLRALPEDILVLADNPQENIYDLLGEPRVVEVQESYGSYLETMGFDTPVKKAVVIG